MARKQTIIGKGDTVRLSEGVKARLKANGVYRPEDEGTFIVTAEIRTMPGYVTLNSGGNIHVSELIKV